MTQAIVNLREIKENMNLISIKESDFLMYSLSQQLPTTVKEAALHCEAKNDKWHTFSKMVLGPART